MLESNTSPVPSPESSVPSERRAVSLSSRTNPEPRGDNTNFSQLNFSIPPLDKRASEDSEKGTRPGLSPSGKQISLPSIDFTVLPYTHTLRSLQNSETTGSLLLGLIRQHNRGTLYLESKEHHSTFCEQAAIDSFWRDNRRTIIRGTKSLLSLAPDTFYGCTNRLQTLSSKELSRITNSVTHHRWHRELEDICRAKIESLSLELEDISFLSLLTENSRSEFVTLHFLFPKELRPLLKEFRDEIQAEYGIRLVFSGDFEACREALFFIRHASKNGQIREPVRQDLCDLVEKEDTASSSTAGKYYHDHRSLHPLTFDASTVSKPEDALVALSLDKKRDFVAYHLPHHEYCPRGFQPDVPVVTSFVGFLLKDGKVVGSNVSSGLVTVATENQYSHERFRLEEKQGRLPVETLDSTAILRKFVRSSSERFQSRSDESSVLLTTEMLVEHVTQLANKHLLRYFEGKGIPLITRRDFLLERDFYQRLKEFDPSLNRSDLIDGCKFTQVLLGLLGGNRASRQLFNDIVRVAKYSTVYAVKNPNEGNTNHESAYFKPRGAAGRANKTQLHHLLHGSPMLPEDELNKRAFLLNTVRRRFAQRTFSLLHKHQTLNHPALVSSVLTSTVRLQRCESMYVHVRNERLSGKVVGRVGADFAEGARRNQKRLQTRSLNDTLLPLGDGALLPREGEIARVLYLGYDLFAGQNLFALVEENYSARCSGSSSN